MAERDYTEEAEQLEETLRKLEEVSGKTLSELRAELQGISNDVLEYAKGFAASNSDTMKALQNELKARKRLLESAEKQVVKQRELLKNASDKQEKFERAISLNDQLIERLQIQIEQNEDNAELVDRLKESQQKIVEDNTLLVKKSSEYQKNVDAMGKSFDSISSVLSKLAKGDFLGVLTSAADGLGAKFKELAKDNISKFYAGIKSGVPKLKDLGAAMTGNGGLVSGLSSAGGAMNALGTSAIASTVSLGVFLAAAGAVIVVLAALAVAIGAVMILANFTLELENSARQLTKVTGLSKDFSHAMHENATELRAMGIAAEDINNSVTALNATFTDFSMLSTTTAKRVTDTTAVLSKLGMSADDSAKGFQTLTKGFAQTPDAAADTMVAMDALARDLGVSTSKIGADFAAAAGHLQKLSGPEAIQSFKQLSVISKATGIEVSRLLAITERFDTFEGAATQAAKLNAALGGNFVNSMELLTATNPAERFGMIRDAILDAGLSFDEMSYYQKKFYADSMGMADVGELALAMSGDFSAVNSELGKTQADYEAAAERAKSFQSVQEQLKNSFYQLMPVITPLLEKINEFTDQFTKFVEANKDDVQSVFRDLGDIMITLVDTFIALTPVMSVILKLFSGLIRLTIFLSEKIGLLALLNYAFKDSMTVKKSPSLLDAVSMLGEGLSNIGEGVESIFSPIGKVTGVMKKLKDSIFGGDDGLTANVQMTAAGVQGIGDASAKTAAAARVAAPVIANSTAIKNATSNTTINNGSGGGQTGVNIRFDNKKFADLFDVQVEKSIGRAARKAVI